MVAVTSYNVKPTSGGAETTAATVRYFYDISAHGHDLLTSIVYQGDDPTANTETFLYNTLGEQTGHTDRNQVTHHYTRDSMGRLISDRVTFATNAPASIDRTIREQRYVHDTLGRVTLAESRGILYGPDNAVISADWLYNSVRREYDGFGQMTKEWIGYSGEIPANAQPSAVWSYQALANTIRLDTMTYIGGATVTYSYTDDSARPRGITYSGTQTTEAYVYLGLSTVMQKQRSGLQWNYDRQLDSFGRTSITQWIEHGVGAIDQYLDTYNTRGQLTKHENLFDARFDQTFTYDPLGRMDSYARGSGNDRESWKLDTQGNRYSERYGTAGTVAKDAQAPGGQTTTVVIGSSTGGAGQIKARLTYDAWGRPVRFAVDEELEYEYDALGRRIETHGRDEIRFVYNGEQLLTELTAQSELSAIYVWSVDGRLLLRHRDTNDDHLVDEVLFALHDGQGNTTAIATPNGEIVQRYWYDHDGRINYRAANWTGGGDEAAHEWKHLYRQWWFETISPAIDGNFHIGGKDAQGFYAVTGSTWYDPWNGRVLQGNPLLEAVGQTKHVNAQMLEGFSWLERNASTIANVVRTGSWFVPGAGLANGLAVNWAGASYERYLDGGSYAILGGLSDATGLTAVAQGVWHGDGRELTIGLLQLTGAACGARQLGQIARDAGSFAVRGTSWLGPRANLFNYVHYSPRLFVSGSGISVGSFTLGYRAPVMPKIIRLTRSNRVTNQSIIY